MRRTMTAAAVAATAALAMAAPVHAADYNQALEFGATLLDQPKGQAWAVDLNVAATLNRVDGGLAAPLRHVFLQFPAGAKVNADKFPKCSTARLEQHKACPRGSLLGEGLAKVDARPLLNNVDAKLALYNGPGNAKKRTLILTANTQDSGIEINLVLPATLARSSGRYSYTFDLDIPEIIAVGGAPPVAITSFNVDVGGRTTKKGKKISFIDAPRSCPRGGWPFVGRFTLGDGALAPMTSRIDCTLRTVAN